VILIVGCADVLPALSLGPVVEHFQALHQRGAVMAKPTKPVSMFDPSIVRPAIKDSFAKARSARALQEPGDVRGGDRLGADDRAPRARHRRRVRHGVAVVGFTSAVTLWLWFTVLFANFAEAVAEGPRPKAQADTLRKMRQETVARKLVDGQEYPDRHPGLAAAQGRPRRGGGRAAHPRRWRDHRGHRVFGSTSRRSPANRPRLIRESGGDRSSVTGGT